jgi:hypothetical protein
LEHDDLYYDVVCGSHSELYVRAVIHHEFFHLLDYKDDGKLYSDPAWSALNPKGFKYGRGGARAQDDALGSLLTDAKPGFLNSYSTQGVEEDKAEVFAYLIVRQGLVEARVKKDDVLAAKVRRMKDLMRSFCPKMDEGFWKAALHLERTGPQPERRGADKSIGK